MAQIKLFLIGALDFVHGLEVHTSQIGDSLVGQVNVQTNLGRFLQVHAGALLILLLCAKNDHAVGLATEEIV